MSESKEKQPLLKIDDLHVSFLTYAGKVQAVRGVSLSMQEGEILAIVGESGCGKSVTAQTILQLNPSPPSVVEGGSIELEGRDLLQLDDAKMRAIRGHEISMIFQDPMTSLNPTMRIGKQIMEAILKHQKVTKKEAYDRAVEMLRLVGLSNPEQRMKQYPFEFSGGMRQRAMIAMALVCRPKILIADEPTTALDVTIQAQILQLIDHMREELGTAVMLITHDMGVVSEMADWVAVMYAGHLVEYTTAGELFTNPKHPYSIGLIKSIPSMDDAVEKLYAIPGSVPMLNELPTGCPFHPRCPYAKDVCRTKCPHVSPLNGDENHTVACWMFDSVEWGE